MTRQTITVLYPHFFPGFKAGGPVQSLVNMITGLCTEYNFQVITSAFDMNDDQPYPTVVVDEWKQVRISETCQIDVCYLSSKQLHRSVLIRKLLEQPTDKLFINGLFTSWSTVPLFACPTEKIIISPRGMLQTGALAGGSIKKKLFITALKLFAGVEKVTWHATNEDEKGDVLREIGANVKIAVAGNIPRMPVKSFAGIEKKPGILNLVYLSLIAAKKNLLLLIRALKNQSATISLDIFGPIKDQDYWEQCCREMQALPPHVRVIYRGEADPQDVQLVIERFHAMVSLTKGENFGHALFECLSVGRPLITSQFTPWNNLSAKHAGWNIDIQEERKISLVLQQIADLDDAAWSKYCEGAWNMANDYYSSSDFIRQYRSLFDDKH